MAVSPVRYEKDSENVATFTFDAPGAQVNTMTEEWQAAFTDAVERLARKKDTTRGVAGVLKDVSAEQAEKGKGYTEKLLVRRKKPNPEIILDFIKPTADYKIFQAAISSSKWCSRSVTSRHR